MSRAHALSISGSISALATLGYPRSYLKRVLPEWWDSSLGGTAAGALQFALMVKERLGINGTFDSNGRLQLEAPRLEARYKKRSSTQISELDLTSRIGFALARFAIRATPEGTLTTATAEEIHTSIREMFAVNLVDFTSLIRFCWRSGVPVLYLDALPAKAAKMAGMAINHNGRHAIVIAHKFEQSARQAFVVAHELGHIVLRHVSRDSVLVDETIQAVEESLRQVTLDDEEKLADQFALTLLRGFKGDLGFDGRQGDSPATLAVKAISEGARLKVDPAHILLSYAYDVKDWRNANLAVRFLPKIQSAHHILETVFKSESSIDKISADDRDFLLAMQGFTAQYD